MTFEEWCRENKVKDTHDVKIAKKAWKAATERAQTIILEMEQERRPEIKDSNWRTLILVNKELLDRINTPDYKIGDGHV